MSPEQHQDLELWRQAFARRMQTFEERLEANTILTKRVDANTSKLVEILNSWEGAMKVFEFVGRIAKPAAAIAAFITAVWYWSPKK